jgi:hypothetical protein
VTIGETRDVSDSDSVNLFRVTIGFAGSTGREGVSEFEKERVKG